MTSVRNASGIIVAAIALAATFGIGCGGGDDPGAGITQPGGASGGGGGGGTSGGSTSHASARAGGGLQDNAMGGTTRWSGRVGGALGDLGHNAVADNQGNVYVAGTFDGTAEVAGVPMTTAGMLDIFIAKFTPTGEAAWVRHYGGAGIDTVTGLAIDAQNNVYFTGTSSATIDLGSGPLGDTNGAGIFFGKLDAFGNALGSTSFGGSAVGTSTLVAVDAQGSVVLAGTYQSSITIGTVILPAATGTYDVFVARFDPTGVFVYAKSFGGNGVDSMQGLGVDATGNAFITGGFTGTADFGTGPLQSIGDSDVFLAKIEPTAGTTLFASRFGGVATDLARSLAVDAQGNVIVTGTYSASVDFGNGPSTAKGNGDVFITKRNPSLDPMWSKTYGGLGEDEAVSVATDSASNVVVAGFFEGAMQVGATPFVSAGERDAFLLKLSPTGTNVFSKHFGAMEDDEGSAIAIDGFGRITVTGYFRTTVDFGTGATTSAGESDVFLATFEP